MAEFRNLSTADMALNTGDMTRVLQELQGTIHFVIKKLGNSQVPAKSICKACRLMMPVWFVREHGDKFHQSVVLRSGSSTEPCRVQLQICDKSARSPTIKFGRGWRAFATCNGLVVGDSLIFELSGMSEFEVYVIRGTGNPNAISYSHIPKKRSADSELSQKNGHYDSNAGRSRHQHLAAERSEGSEDDLSVWIAKKRETGEEGAVSASQSTLQNSSCIISHLLELESVQVASSKKRHESQNSQELPVDHEELRMHFSGDGSAQNTGARKVHVKKEFQQSKISLPNFIQLLVVDNVQDGAGNTCGACFEIPYIFVKTHGIKLQAPIVKLQGIREESPVRTVTCSQNMQKDGECSTWPPLSLGWGDFVRENALCAGQEVVFTLTAELVFVVREIPETSI